MEGIENSINKNSLHQVSELNPGNFTFNTTSFLFLKPAFI